MKKRLEEDNKRLYIYLEENQMLMKEILMNNNNNKNKNITKTLLINSIIEYYKEYNKKPKQNDLIKIGFKVQKIVDCGGMKMLCDEALKLIN